MKMILAVTETILTVTTWCVALYGGYVAIGWLFGWLTSR